MERISRPLTAERAGVETSFVEKLVELGILGPDGEGRLAESDVRRVRIMQVLEDAGLPLEGVAEALRSSALSLDFIDTPTYERWASLSTMTFQGLSDRTKVPVELLAVIREAMGFVPPEPDDRVRENELPVVPLVQLQHRHGFRPEVIERALRVYGENMRRIAETESDWWRSEVVMPIIHAGLAPTGLSEAANELSPVLAEVSDQAILAIYHGQQAHSWMRNILEGFEIALAAAGIQTRLERVPAICFLDLTGYTRLTEEQGDAAAAALARDLASVVQRSSMQHGGRAVKWLGDGVMFHFPEPGRGVMAALDMVEAAKAAGLPPAHVGLHAGQVLFQEGDYFGRTVNIAARIADYARPGEVLVSQEVVEASRSEAAAFQEIGQVELKGVSGPVHLYRAQVLA
ncbi:MAG: adenylate/guanylate cyclase domain-containing protein [Acidimicrobiia bacterium]